MSLGEEEKIRNIAEKTQGTKEIMSIFKTMHSLADCDLIQVKLFHLPMDKQILKKRLSCVVKYLVRQVGHGISTVLIYSR